MHIKASTRLLFISMTFIFRKVLTILRYVKVYAHTESYIDCARIFFAK